MATKTKRRKVNLARVKKLSTLLAIGLRDLRKQERAKNSVVSMGDWLCKEDGTCHACLAGSVMRFSLKTKMVLGDAHPWMHTANVCQRLLALNELRCGFVLNAAQRIDVKTKFRSRLVADYATSLDQ